MKKSDLTTGMVVQLRNGGKYMVNVEAQTIISLDPDTNYRKLTHYYLDDLRRSAVDFANLLPDTTLDIVKVYAIPAYSLTNLNLLWERQEQTPEQLEAASIRKEMEALAARLKKLEGK